MVDRTADVARERGPGAALAEAHLIRDEELAASTAMGEVGADLVIELTGRPSVRAMTICNTGGLATVERGTALAVIQTLHERGALGEAIPVETRPLLQGARLTTWELDRMGAPYRLAVDSAGPFLLAQGGVDVVLIGADRIAANGDTANKIGSFSLALGAQHAGVPFIVVAPESTFDQSTPDGETIEVEYRPGVEVTGFAGTRTAAIGAEAINPAFDITPAGLITAIVTDRRVIRP
jgi:methylthioribose-1-phosphate isomerase